MWDTFLIFNLPTGALRQDTKPRIVWAKPRRILRLLVMFRWYCKNRKCPNSVPINWVLLLVFFELLPLEGWYVVSFLTLTGQARGWRRQKSWMLKVLLGQGYRTAQGSAGRVQSKGGTKKFAEKPTPVPLRSPRISYGITRDWTQAFVVRS
jgi:hypothetical protein